MHGDRRLSAMVVDSRFTSETKRAAIYGRLVGIDASIRRNVEEENLDAYRHTPVHPRAVGGFDVTSDRVSEKERQAVQGRPPGQLPCLLRERKKLKNLVKGSATAAEKLDILGHFSGEVCMHSPASRCRRVRVKSRVGSL